MSPEFTASQIPYHRWQPLSIAEVTHVFEGAPFVWGLAGGYAIEQFIGRSIRDHSDIDVLVCRDNQLELQTWLDKDWTLYAADPPGSLRLWKRAEYLPQGIHDIWAHRTQCQSWQMQLMLMEVAENRWFSRRNHLIGGDRADLIVLYGGIPCVRVEVQLLFKSKDRRPKDLADFHACLPKMTEDAKEWLFNQLHVLYPEGHPWEEPL
jgi:hypothetical protein